MGTQQTNEPIHIGQENEHEYQVHNLPCNESIYLQVENFDVAIKRTDEGIVIDVYDVDAVDYSETLASTYAFHADTTSYQEGE